MTSRPPLAGRVIRPQRYYTAAESARPDYLARRFAAIRRQQIAANVAREQVRSALRSWIT